LPSSSWLFFFFLDAHGVVPMVTLGAAIASVHDVCCVAAGQEGVESEGDGAAADLAFHAFPTLDQLSEATEQALRDSGFGYRCDAANSTSAGTSVCRWFCGCGSARHGDTMDTSSIVVFLCVECAQASCKTLVQQRLELSQALVPLLTVSQTLPSPVSAACSQSAQSLTSLP
jgi:hypothetical protein